jgi:hypothetical protein
VFNKTQKSVTNSETGNNPLYWVLRCYLSHFYILFILFTPLLTPLLTQLFAAEARLGL